MVGWAGGGGSGVTAFVSFLGFHVAASLFSDDAFKMKGATAVVLYPYCL